MQTQTDFNEYLKALRYPFVKRCRLRVLDATGQTLFALDNNSQNALNKGFVADGTISVNLQNGARRTVDITLANVSEELTYTLNTLWYNTQIALDEGLVLPNGQDFYIQQGVFVITDPAETVNPAERTINYTLKDKWANLDGTLNGNLDTTYIVNAGENIFTPITALLAEDKGNGYPIDRVTPIFTEYYNGITQTLPNGTTVPVIQTPYTLEVDTNKADVILKLCEMLNAWVGYDASGALRIDPSQDDISDLSKPVLWHFSQKEAALSGLTYNVKNTEVYNDYIIIGEQLDNNRQPNGRAQNLDPASDTNVNLIGRKTKREIASGYATDKQCRDLAEWKLKRATVLQKSVNITCSQMFHIRENDLVTVVRTDKQGAPVERHLIQGFSRPLTHNGAMTISCTSVNDFPSATITTWQGA